MLEKIRTYVKESKTAQFAIVFISGLAVGAIFYPTKRIEERLTQKHQEEITKLVQQHNSELHQEQERSKTEAKRLRQYKSESEKQISLLTKEVTELRSKKVTNYYKIVHPDGTVEVKKSSETDVSETQQVVTQIKQEFKEKLDEVEKRWETAYKERLVSVKKDFQSKEENYKKQIDELSKSKVTEINKKSFGLEVGLLTNNSYYGHLTYDVFGPFFIGFHAQINNGNVSPSNLGPAGLGQAGLGLGLRF